VTFPQVDYREEPEHDDVRRQHARRHADGSAARHQARHRELPRAVQAAVLVRGSALRRDQGLLQVGRLPAGRAFRGQPLPQLVERGVRGGRVALRAVQLGRAPPRQRQGGAARQVGRAALRVRRPLLPHRPARVHLRVLPAAARVAAPQEHHQSDRFRGVAVCALALLPLRPLLPRPQHQGRDADRLDRRRHRAHRHARAHAVQPHLPLQPQVLRQRGRRLRHRQSQAIRHAGVYNKRKRIKFCLQSLMQPFRFFTYNIHLVILNFFINRWKYLPTWYAYACISSLK
jgi:hypothetical protein